VRIAPATLGLANSFGGIRFNGVVSDRNVCFYLREGGMLCSVCL
jgi:hypothetical protein